jgi:hypothetical protein
LSYLPSKTVLRKGIEQLRVANPEARGGLSLFLGQKKDATQRWVFEVIAKTADGPFDVGRFTTCPPHHGSLLSRLVATVAVPGAEEYTVKIYPAIQGGDFGGTPDYDGVAWASLGEPGGQLPGIVRVNERPRYYAGDSPQTLRIPAGERVIAWSAFSTGAGASVTLNVTTPNGITITGDVIPVPAGGGVRGGDGGLFEGPLSLDFVDVAIGGWLVETAESA